MITGENGTGESAPVKFSKDASGQDEPSDPSDTSAARDRTGESLQGLTFYYQGESDQGGKPDQSAILFLPLPFHC